MEVSCPQIQLSNPKFLAFGIKAWLSSAMAETRSSIAATQEAIASLRIAFDHYAKEIQEMRTIQEVHTQTLNEMNQQLAILVQRHGGFDQGGLPPSPTNGEIRHT